MIGNLFDPWHLLLILIVALIVFGPDKLPEVAQTVGKAMKEFKEVSTGLQKQFTEAMKIDDLPVISTKVFDNLDNKDFMQQIINKNQPATAPAVAESVPGVAESVPGAAESILAPVESNQVAETPGTEEPVRLDEMPS